MSDWSGGTLGRLGLLTPECGEKSTDLLARIAADGIETVRFVFPDQHGVLRGKTLVADAVPSAVRNGITAPSSLLLKDTSHRTVFPVWEEDAGFGAGALTGAGDLLMVPDVDTYVRLPWSPHSAWIVCDVVQAAGGPIPFASRTLLDQAVGKLAVRQLDLVVGLEIEFHVFRITDANLIHGAGGMPGQPAQTAPLNHGYQLLSENVYSQAEPILDELRRTSQAMGLSVVSAEIEFGPSQFEFTFAPAPAREQADNLVLFRSMAKQVCARQGLLATFMCRPVVENAAASGWHIHQSLVDTETGANRFMPATDQPSTMAGQWIAGLLQHAGESCLLTTPTVNGYRRYQPHKLAPDRIQWGWDNKGAMVRALFCAGDPASRIENRIADPAANPHYALAAQIVSGLSGVEEALKPPPPVERPYDADAPMLPTDLGAAISAFEAGSLYASAFGESFARYFAHLKKAEWRRYLSTLSDWEQAEYSGLV